MSTRFPDFTSAIVTSDLSRANRATKDAWQNNETVIKITIVYYNYYNKSDHLDEIKPEFFQALLWSYIGDHGVTFHYHYLQVHLASKLLYLSYLPTTPLGLDMTQGQFLSGV